MNGVIIVDKPAGPTSAEVVRRVKSRLAKGTRVGHLGTLDPFATGILPILVGEGTKLAPFLQEGIKEYAGLIRLGSETDTLDSTGQITRTALVPGVNPTDLASIARRFTGTIDQTPPIYSAIKRAGIPLYKFARRGIPVEPPTPRKVEIQRLELTVDDDEMIRFDVICSSGMYVRSLARDIGTALGTAAHLAQLRRTRNGAFTTVDAETLDRVLAAIESGYVPRLVTMRGALTDWPEVVIDARLELRLRQGDSRALDGLSPEGAEFFKVASRGELVAVARRISRASALIVRVFGT